MKDIKNYEGLYAVTDGGEVWSHKRAMFLKPYYDKKGYISVCLYKGGKRKHCRVHRLVLETFNPVEGMDELQVNHIDEDKHNNNLSNLDWTTAKENTQYSIKSRKGKKRGKIKPVEQYSLDGELLAVYESQAAAARATGINRYNISNVFRGHQKTAGGYLWRYKD